MATRFIEISDERLDALKRDGLWSDAELKRIDDALFAIKWIAQPENFKEIETANANVRNYFFNVTALSRTGRFKNDRMDERLFDALKVLEEHKIVGRPFSQQDPDGRPDWYAWPSHTTSFMCQFFNTQDYLASDWADLFLTGLIASRQPAPPPPPKERYKVLHDFRTSILGGFWTFYRDQIIDDPIVVRAMKENKLPITTLDDSSWWVCQHCTKASPKTL